MRPLYRFAFLLLSALLTTIPGFSQDVPEEDVFHLVEANQAQQETFGNMSFRRVWGDAKFLHNNTYLLCDSASWNVDRHKIDAFGHVKIIQGNTILCSDNLTYYIERNLAEFRGSLVELFDKEGNTLRTEYLNYDTKDSVATFFGGGALRDTSGNVMESRQGTYDAKVKTFTFENKVEMFVDSIRIKTATMHYVADLAKAFFGKDTYMWRGNGFLKANAGSYDRNTQISNFKDKVYMNDPSYEAWSDDVVYDQVTGRADMYRNSQILDTTHSSYYLADCLIYEPKGDTADLWQDRVILTMNPAIVYCGENENHQPDTLYMRGDSIKIFSMKKCDFDEKEFTDAKKRVEDMEFDALAKSRDEMAKVREEERIKKMQEAGLMPTKEALAYMEKQKADSLARVDSLRAVAFADSLAAQGLDSTEVARQVEEWNRRGKGAAEDTLAVPKDTAAAVDSVAAVDTVDFRQDTTLVRVITSFNNVKAFRKDVQVACDSMIFTEIDSVARLHGDPVLWNEIKNQLTAEVMHLMLKNGNLYRGSMVTDAWVISQEDSIHFHQIKSTEMLGYFHENQLYRYDALGGVNAVFYVAEKAKLTTVNIKEAKSLTALIKDGNAKRMLYMESIKSDAYPIGELARSKQRLKGFKWRGDERPVDRFAITSQPLRTSQREKYEKVVPPKYDTVNKYFDNCMSPEGAAVGAAVTAAGDAPAKAAGDVVEERADPRPPFRRLVQE